MWESKDQTLDINYNVAELWFLGVYGVPVPKPTEIKKWEEGKCYLLLDKHIPRLKADRMLQDLSQIALKYAQSTVQQRLTLKPTSKARTLRHHGDPLCLDLPRARGMFKALLRAVHHQHAPLSRHLRSSATTS